MKSFTLVNPHIEGTCKKTFSAQDAHSASEKAWNSLSKYFNNSVPKFAFTLQEGGNHELHHFLVREKIQDGSVDYDISKYTVNAKNEENLKKNLTTLQKGGKKHHKHDDSSSSSDSDSDSSSEWYTENIYTKIKHSNIISKTAPIYYWAYDPLVYDLDYYYTPTFVAPLTPYVQIVNSVLPTTYVLY